MKKSSLVLFLFSLCFLEDANAHTTFVVERPHGCVVVDPCPCHNRVVVEHRAPVCCVVENCQPPCCVVDTCPPAEIEEEIGPCPGAEYVWIKGCWQWDGCRWVRAKGRWAVKPHASAVWVSGCWAEHRGHWRWSAGYWR